jgi:trk system potassium uptake protein TrkA
VQTLISIVNQKEHSELFKEIGVRISENPDEIVARSLYIWSENPETKLLASIEGCSIFEIKISKVAQGVNKTVCDASDVKDMLYIAIRRDITSQSGDIITVFTKKEAESKSVEYTDNLFH